ncbi:MAG: outer membrane protein assembly factor BamE [Alphaproteobacteria bacterium]|nr:outer membrane protein assembly factor BamE [Alphaproteobacteria bacterium]
MKYQLLRHLFMCCGAILLISACSPTIANRGNLIEAEKLAEIKTGTSTRAEVADKLGTPTQVGAFDENVWYYFGRRTEQYSFFDPEIVEQQAVEVRFDDQGTVVAVNKLDPSLNREISPVSRSTPTYGHESSIFEQLVGNLGRPGMPIKGQK